MGTLGSLLVRISFMVALGFFLYRKNWMDDAFKKKLSALLLNVILPISILTSAGSEFSADMAGKLLQSAGIAGAYYISALALSYLASRRLALGEGGRAIFVCMTVFANVGFIGFPLIGELYGAEGTLYAVIYNLMYQIFLFTIGISLLSGSGKMDWRLLAKDPMTIASAAAILLFLMPFRLPGVVMEALDSVGSMTVPVSMMIIGCELAKVSFRDILRDPYSYLVSAVRLALLPLGMLLVLWLLHADKGLTAVMVVMTALPCGSLNVILAEKYGCEPEFAARTVIQSMVLMVATIPLLLLLLRG